MSPAPAAPDAPSRPALASFTHGELRAFLAANDFTPTHADRIARDLIRGRATSFSEVEGLGEAGAARLDELVAPRATRVIARTDAPDGTVKLLVELADGERVESVLMPLAKRMSGCVSSQVGCGAACAFCASGLAGLRRSLTAGEIVEQVLHLRDEARRQGAALSNLVFMGMGEPLHAYDAVVGAVRRLTDPKWLGFGCSHVTISTVGVVPAMLALAEEDLGVNLAVSLHAADDALRRRLLPVGGRSTVAQTLDAAEAFRVRTRRFVTIQVTLMAGVNDQPEHAQALCDAIAGRPFHVNLIPVNRVEGTPYEPPEQPAIDAFLAVLACAKVVAHVRSRRGDDANAACGQLRRSVGGGRVAP